MDLASAQAWWLLGWQSSCETGIAIEREMLALLPFSAMARVELGLRPSQEAVIGTLFADLLQIHPLVQCGVEAVFEEKTGCVSERVESQTSQDLGKAMALHQLHQALEPQQRRAPELVSVIWTLTPHQPWVQEVEMRKLLAEEVTLFSAEENHASPENLFCLESHGDWLESLVWLVESHADLASHAVLQASPFCQRSHVLGCLCSGIRAWGSPFPATHVGDYLCLGRHGEGFRGCAIETSPADHAAMALVREGFGLSLDLRQVVFHLHLFLLVEHHAEGASQLSGLPSQVTDLHVLGAMVDAVVGFLFFLESCPSLYPSISISIAFLGGCPFLSPCFDHDHLGLPCRLYRLQTHFCSCCHGSLDHPDLSPLFRGLWLFPARHS